MLEPEARKIWELEVGVNRMKLREGKAPGRAPQWRWNKKTGKLTRGGKGGIDWWRYQKIILIPKLIPFAKECEAAGRLGMLIQEDKAPAHSHSLQQQVFDQEGARRLPWPGNSPDLNVIEPAWPWMKRYTTKKGAPRTRKEAITRWEKAWKDLPQEQIQRWIERIPRHVQKVIELAGGNEYVEGRGTAPANLHQN